METFTVDVRAAGLLSGLRNAEKRMAYAVANALNKTAKDIQKEQQARAAKLFTLRDKRDFILRQVAVIKFANVKKGINEVRISVGQKRRLLLPGYETGEMRNPFKGKTSVAVPVIGGARPSKAAPVSPDLYLKALAFKSTRRATKGRRPVLVGLKGTYMLPGIGVFQKVSKSISRALYLLVKPFKLPAHLQWVATARGVAGSKFSGHMVDEVRATLKHAFGKGLR